MTPEEFADEVREEAETPLSRLGSSKSLYADTMGEMEESAVLEAVADAEHAAAETFAAWADEASGSSDDGDGQDATSSAFREAADAARDRYDTVLGELGEDEYQPGDVPTIQEYLRGLDDPIARLGGLVGHALVADRKTNQVTGFFTGQADPRTASTFREMGEDFDAQLDTATERLVTVCSSDVEFDRAIEAATDAVQAAYDEYFERLESMGVSPKPVC